LHGRSLARLSLVQVCAECSVTQLFHGPPDRFSFNLSQ
jgi:hypothetical protein